MEAELTVRERAVPGLTTFDHGTRSLALHETPCFSGERPFNQGLFHTGCGGGPEGTGELTIFGLNTAIQSVGEGNYGRLAQQRRYTEANIEPMFSEPATGGRPDEQPGAIPEIMPSPRIRQEHRSLLDLPRDVHAGLGALRHGLARDPPAPRRASGSGRGTLEVTPQVPPYERASPGAHPARRGEADVVAVDRGRRHRTVVDARLRLDDLTLGHTVEHGARIDEVWLDGRRVRHPELRETNRGLEVLADVRGRTSGRHVLVVTTR